MQESLEEVISTARDRIVGVASGMALFLDFGGTPIPIQPDPAAPRLGPDTAETLQSIASQE
jgi:trehalose-6-phosphatase